jgi:hypothetical protein
MNIIIPGPNNELIISPEATPPQYPVGAASLFTPTVSSDWETSPVTIQAALDEIASRLRSGSI